MKPTKWEQRLAKVYDAALVSPAAAVLAAWEAIEEGQGFRTQRVSDSARDAVDRVIAARTEVPAQH